MWTEVLFKLWFSLEVAVLVSPVICTKTVGDVLHFDKNHNDMMNQAHHYFSTARLTSHQYCKKTWNLSFKFEFCNSYFSFENHLTATLYLAVSAKTDAFADTVVVQYLFSQARWNEHILFYGHDWILGGHLVMPCPSYIYSPWMRSHEPQGNTVNKPEACWPI